MISFVVLPLLAEMLMGDPEIPQRFKRGARHYAALLSKLDGAAAVPSFLLLFISFSNPLVKNALN